MNNFKKVMFLCVGMVLVSGASFAMYTMGEDFPRKRKCEFIDRFAKELEGCRIQEIPDKVEYVSFFPNIRGLNFLKGESFLARVDSYSLGLSRDECVSSQMQIALSSNAIYFAVMICGEGHKNSKINIYRYQDLVPCKSSEGRFPYMSFKAEKKNNYFRHIKYSNFLKKENGGLLLQLVEEVTPESEKWYKKHYCEDPEVFEFTIE